MSLHKNHLDFEIISTGNTKTLVFLDSSEYFEVPDRPLLQITPPGFNRYFIVNVTYGKVNTFNSSTIGMNPVLQSSSLVDLPDGVWTLTYMICPYDKLLKRRYHLRTALLKRKLNQIFDYADCDCEFARNDKFRAAIVDIILLMEKGQANAEEGEAAKAADAYSKAVSKANKLLDGLSKSC